MHYRYDPEIAHEHGVYAHPSIAIPRLMPGARNAAPRFQSRCWVFEAPALVAQSTLPPYVKPMNPEIIVEPAMGGYLAKVRYADGVLLVAGGAPTPEAARELAKSALEFRRKQIADGKLKPRPGELL